MKPQTSDLIVGKLKGKILREPVGVALHGKIQRFGGNAVGCGPTTKSVAGNTPVFYNLSR